MAFQQEFKIKNLQYYISLGVYEKDFSSRKTFKKTEKPPYNAKNDVIISKILPFCHIQNKY